MAQIVEIIEEAANLAEAAKKIRDGVVEGYNDVVSVYDTISTKFRQLLGTAVGAYDNPDRFRAIASFTWLKPSMYILYIERMSHMTFSNYDDRELCSSYLSIISKYPNSLSGLERFPANTVLFSPFRNPILPLHLKLCWCVSIPRTVTPEELKNYDENFYKTIKEILETMEMDGVVVDRASFELFNHLKWTYS